MYAVPSTKEAQQRALQQLTALDESVTRLDDPQPYPVGLEENLYAMKDRLIREAEQIRRTSAQRIESSR